MTTTTKPWETKGAAKYYFDLAGELRVQHSEMLEALEAIYASLPTTGPVGSNDDNWGLSEQESEIAKLCSAAIQKARGGQ